MNDLNNVGALVCLCACLVREGHRFTGPVSFCHDMCIYMNNIHDILILGKGNQPPSGQKGKAIQIIDMHSSESFLEEQ